MRWEIPAEPSPKEVRLASRLKRGSKFFAFLWEIRAKLFSPEFQDELISGFDRNRSDNVTSFVRPSHATASSDGRTDGWR